MLQTERMILRNLQEDDAADLYEYSKDEAVGKNAGWKPHENIEESMAILQERFLGQEDIFGMVLKENGKLVGTVGFVEDPDCPEEGTAMLGYALGVNYWGKGYMTEAVQAVLTYGFMQKQLRKITVTHYTDNLRSQSVIVKSGFQYQGIKKQAEANYDGTMKDVMWYVLKKEDFCRSR